MAWVRKVVQGAIRAVQYVLLLGVGEFGRVAGARRVAFLTSDDIPHRGKVL